MYTIVTSRFNNETRDANHAYRIKNGFACMYCCPLELSPKIPYNTPVFVIEMNNSTNKIEGIGLIKNKLGRFTQCAVLPARNWKLELLHHQIGGEGKNRSFLLYQDDCDFNIEFDIEKPQCKKSFNDCVIYCFNMTRCTQSSCISKNGIFNVKNVPLLTNRLTVGGADKMCGSIPDQQHQSHDLSI